MFTDYVSQVTPNRTNLKLAIHFKIQLNSVVNPIKSRGCRDTGYSVASLEMEEYWQCLKKKKNGIELSSFLLTLIKVQK